jgi:uncharacterized coiled-coil protein SlyX
MSDPHGEDIMELNETVSAQREMIGELQAEVQRLRAEMDQLGERFLTILVPTGADIQAVMDSCRGEEPHTVLRTTGFPVMEWKLDNDHVWVRRL